MVCTWFGLPTTCLATWTISLSVHMVFTKVTSTHSFCVTLLIQAFSPFWWTTSSLGFFVNPWVWCMAAFSLLKWCVSPWHVVLAFYLHSRHFRVKPDLTVAMTPSFVVLSSRLFSPIQPPSWHLSQFLFRFQPGQSLVFFWEWTLCTWMLLALEAWRPAMLLSMLLSDYTLNKTDGLAFCSLSLKD